MKLVYPLILSVIALTAQAKSTLRLQSGEQKVALIELYTSEGCSSCPPADRWLSGLKTDPGLWQTFIPIGFHVDYWDYIGWKDKLALPGNAQRQTHYEAENKISSVYTPGFVVNGKEWQGWFKQQSLPEQPLQKAGVLTVEITGDQIVIDYAGAPQELEYHAVILGFEVHSEVERGENAGRLLSHDFVALSHQTARSDRNRATLTVPETELFRAPPRALAVWINTPDSLGPVQAVGGWLVKQK